MDNIFNYMLIDINKNLKRIADALEEGNKIAKEMR